MLLVTTHGDHEPPEADDEYAPPDFREAASVMPRDSITLLGCVRVPYCKRRWEP